MITLIGCSSNKIYNEPSDKYPFDEKMKTVLGENLEVLIHYEEQKYKFHILI